MNKLLQIPGELGSIAFETTFPRHAERWRNRNLFDRPGWLGTMYLMRDALRYGLPQLPAIIREIRQNPEDFVISELSAVPPLDHLPPVAYLENYRTREQAEPIEPEPLAA